VINSKKIFLFVTCFFASVFSIAQQIKNESSVDKYRAAHWGLENGLSQGCVFYTSALHSGTNGGLGQLPLCCTLPHFC